MATSTNIVEVSEVEYVNASNGNLNLALMVKFNQKLRIHIGPSETPPDHDVEEHFTISGGSDEFTGSRFVMMFENLAAEDDVWIRSESGFEYVTVVRGGVVITGNR